MKQTGNEIWNVELGEQSGQEVFGIQKGILAGNIRMGFGHVYTGHYIDHEPMSNIETDCGRTGCSGWPPLPNATTEVYRTRGLEPEALYHFYSRKLQYNVKDFGDLVNTVFPIHIRQDSLAYNLVVRFVKMDGETKEQGCAPAGGSSL